MLVDMARKREKEEAHSEIAAPAPTYYPYGLCISLEGEDLAKLGMALPDVGTVVDLVIKAKVTSVTARDSSEGESYTRVELQITQMGLPEAPRSAVEKMTARYGEKS